MASERAALEVTVSEGVAEVVLRGPGKGNALGPDFWAEMPVVADELDRDSAVRVVVVRGSGAHFTYGLDLPAMGGLFAPLFNEGVPAAERLQLYEEIGRLQRAFDRLAYGRKPVIGAASGWCVGGGVHLLAACDMRLASADARFSLREVRLAITPDLGALQRLPRLVGEGWARRLAFTGENVDAATALRIGLVDELYESPEALLAGARAIARSIADNPPLVVQGIKRVMNRAEPPALAQGLDYVALWNAAFLPSHDLAEGVAAAVERRPPKFSGR
jgi:enoyl-CoA hydratase